MEIAALRAGLAANLRALSDVNVRLYLETAPTGPTLQVAGIEHSDYVQDFGDGMRMLWVIEGCAGKADSDASFKRFDRWVSADGADSLRTAVEADRTLTKRMAPDGTITTDQAPVVADLQVREFRGYRRHRYDTGVEVLLGDWLVEVLT